MWHMSLLLWFTACSAARTVTAAALSAALLMVYGPGGSCRRLYICEPHRGGKFVSSTFWLLLCVLQVFACGSIGAAGAAEWKGQAISTTRCMLTKCDGAKASATMVAHKVKIAAQHRSSCLVRRYCHFNCDTLFVPVLLRCINCLSATAAKMRDDWQLSYASARLSSFSCVA